MHDHKNLIVILGDQLSTSISSLSNCNRKKDMIVMMELLDEATYVKHHPYKIILIFSAMRHFAEALTKKGYNVTYIKLDDKQNQHNFTDTLKIIINQIKPQKLTITEPGEYRILEMIEGWEKAFQIPVSILEDTRFYCNIDSFKQWAKDKKQLRMEYFYRKMRKEMNILMKNGKPIGGKWNYDSDNRQAPPKDKTFKAPPQFQPDKLTQKVIALVKKHFSKHFGVTDDFTFAVTHTDAKKCLHFFCQHHLEEFGTYQDAMLLNEYNLYHSQLSMYLNIGLLLPKDIIDSVLETYHNKKIALHNVEGFIRQILGWREFIRGMYWLHMPTYKKLNFFNHKNKLPELFWTGETDMTCVKHCIAQTRETANSHHIQRLMITGNFALLLHTDPQEICEWYLSVYADAFEWVELPNTLGMSQFGDGGIIASKPYISSGNYINKMSNFCANCHYDVKLKIEDNACPFNFLYWHFLITHKKKLEQNPRLKFAYNHVNKLSQEDIKKIKAKAQTFQKSLNMAIP